MTARRQPSNRKQEVPLTHHEIMGLVAPFTRRGFSLDLAASDRARRRLVFRGEDVPAEAGCHPALECRLTLELPGRARPRLTRLLSAGNGGPEATALVRGRRPEELLEAVLRLPARRQLRTVAGVPVAFGYQLPSPDPEPGELRGRPLPDRPCLVLATAEFDAFTLTFRESTSEMPFEVTLTPREGCRLSIPQDFLAVLGWRWRPLQRRERGVWQGTVKPAAKEPERTPQLEAMFEQTVGHLVETLALAPAAFHERHRRARWRVAFQRAVPLMGGVGIASGLVILAFALPKTHLVHMLLAQAPILIIALVSSQKEVPQMEIPPLPQTLTQRQWCVRA